MTAVFLQILNISIAASWLIAAVLLVRLLLKKAPKAATVALWGLVALRLVLPFSVESAFSLVPPMTAVTVTDTSATVATTAQTTAKVTAPTTLSPTNAPVAVVTKPSTVTPATTPVTVATKTQETTPVTAATEHPIVPTQAATVTTTTASVAATAKPLSWATVATVVWCVGMAAMLVYGVVSTLRLRHRVKASVRLHDNVYLCDDIESPFILGIIKPRIYLPSTLSQAERENVLAHETAHLKRGDHVIKPFGFLLLTVYWFHPLVWVAYVLLCRDIEFACDERVFRTLNDDAKKAYLETLLRCSAPRRAISACPLAFGETSVKERIHSALSYKKPTLWIMLVSIVAVIAVAVCFLTVRPAAKPETPAPKKQAVTTTAKPHAEKRYTPVHGSIAVGEQHIVALRADGTVMAAGSNEYGQCDVEGWTDIIAVAAGDNHTVGLKSNGTVVAIGANRLWQADISGSNMIAVDACDVYSAKLNANGRASCTVGYSSNQIDPSDWTDITAIAAGEEHMVGLKADGTVVTTGRKNYGQWYVGDWTDIVAVAAGDHHTVGLKADGTVVATGANSYGQCDVEDWTDIVAVAAGYHYTVGLKSDGTLVATGTDDDYEYDRQEFLSWTGIVEVAVGENFIAAVKEDGTVAQTSRYAAMPSEERDYLGGTWFEPLLDTVASWTDIRTTAFERQQPQDILEDLQAMTGKTDDSSIYLVDNEEWVEVCVRLPYIDDEATEILSTEIYRKMRKQFDRGFDFRLLREYEAPKKPDGMTWFGKIDYQIVYRSDTRMDILFTGLVHPTSAAHPTNVYFALNWDPVEKRLLTFEEVYAADEALYTAYRQAVQKAYAPRFSGDELTAFMDQLCTSQEFFKGLRNGDCSWYTTENGIVFTSPVSHVLGDVVTAEIVNGISLRAAAFGENTVFDDTYVEYSVLHDGNKSYYFSNRNHIFSVKLQRFFTSTYLIPSNEPYAQDSKTYYLSVSGSDQRSISFPINAADQVRIGVDAVYTCPGIYAALEEWLVPLLQEQDRYGEVALTSVLGQFEYTVYDRSGEVLDTDTDTREPHLFVYDSVIAHRWAQYGTGILTRQSYFYDLESGKRSPLYNGQTDHFDELVCAALHDKVEVCDMFSGDVLQTIDTFEKPLADIAENIQCAYFTKDRTAVEVRYYTTDMTVVTETVALDV